MGWSMGGRVMQEKRIRRWRRKDETDEWKDGWVEEWIDGWMEGWTDGWKDGKKGGWVEEWIDGWMEEWMDGRKDEWVKEWFDGWMDGWIGNGGMDRWMDEWMDRRMDRWIGWWIIWTAQCRSRMNMPCRQHLLSESFCLMYHTQTSVAYPVWKEHDRHKNSDTLTSPQPICTGCENITSSGLNLTQ